MRQYVGGLVLFGLSALPTLANSQAKDQQSIYLVCQQASGSSTYLPGGFVPIDRAETVDDEFNRVLSVILTSGPAAKLLELAWILESGTVTVINPSESEKVRAGYAGPDIKRFDIDWLRGSSGTILVKGLGSGVPHVAYIDISAGFGVDKVSSFVTACAELSTKADAVEKIREALLKMKKESDVVDLAATEAPNVIDAAEPRPDTASNQPQPKTERKRK